MYNTHLEYFAFDKKESLALKDAFSFISENFEVADELQDSINNFIDMMRAEKDEITIYDYLNVITMLDEAIFEPLETGKASKFYENNDYIEIIYTLRNVIIDFMIICLDDSKDFYKPKLLYLN